MTTIPPPPAGAPPSVSSGLPSWPGWGMRGPGKPVRGKPDGGAPHGGPLAVVVRKRRDESHAKPCGSRRLRNPFVPDFTLPPIQGGLAPVITKIPTKHPVVFLTIDDGLVKSRKASGSSRRTATRQRSS
ncbi:hypothetical protein AHiyo8_29650 [Arthrobacter sp. Hiyo8]|nr:hypothetical protein AHiyo8_29650 [Arthrobacter sp. Hiyo8]